MSQTCGNQISQVFIKVLNIFISCVADVGVGFGAGASAAIRDNCRVDSRDKLICVLDDLFLHCVTGVSNYLLHVWCSWQPDQAMDMRAATMLPTKHQPIVSGSKDSNVEGLDKLHDSMVEEPVCEGWVLNDCLGTGSPGVRVV